MFHWPFKNIVFGALDLEQGVDANREKARTMVNWPQPKDVSELRGFLGLTGYRRRFVRKYGDIAGPLHQATTKKCF